MAGDEKPFMSGRHDSVWQACKGSANHSLLLSKHAAQKARNSFESVSTGPTCHGGSSLCWILTFQRTGDRTGWGVGQTQQDIGSGHR